MRIMIRPNRCCSVLCLALLISAAASVVEAQTKSSAEELAAEIVSMTQPADPQLEEKRPSAEFRPLLEFKQAEATISRWDLTDDNSRLATLDNEGIVRIWNLADGQTKVCEIKTSANKPGPMVTLSPDGSKVAVSNLQGNVEVFDADNGQLLHDHRALTQATPRIGFTDDGERIFAIDSRGNSFITPLLEDGSVHSGPENPDGKNPATRLFASTNENSWWKIVQGQDLQNVHSFFDGQKFLSPIMIDVPLPMTLIGGTNRYMLAHIHKFAIVACSRTGEQTNLRVSYGHSPVVIHSAAFSGDDRQLWLYSNKSVAVCDEAGKPTGFVPLPESIRDKRARIYPDAKTLAVLQRDGTLTLWKLHGEPSLSDFVNPIPPNLKIDTTIEIRRLFATQRFDAIELLAKKWDGETNHFLDDEHETPYSFLVGIAQSYKLRGESEQQRNDRYLKWIENNPDNCQFMRIAMFRIYLAAGYRARGQGFANSVTPEGAKIYMENMESMWEVIKPIFDDEHVPAEAFTCGVITGKNLQWPRETVNACLIKSFASWPNYHRTYAEEAVARLPRWGGEPEDTAAFTEKLANKIGGDAGDIMYAQIGRHVANYVSLSKLTESTGLSPTRTMRGLVLLSQQTTDLYAINQSLLFAALIEDKESLRKVCDRLIELEEKPSNQVWPGKYPLLDMVYHEAQAATSKP